MSWDRPFDQPVPLPDKRRARTLRDAGNYIRELPQSQRETPEWRLAVQMLIDASEDRGPMLFAKMGIERAVELATIISAGRTETASDFRFPQRAVDNRSNRRETQPPSAATRKHGLFEHGRRPR